MDQILTEHLTSVPIEDLPLRFFCVSASLTRAEAVIHERGPLWTAVRASLALPGIYPPVYADGDLLIDGAAVDNLPVDVMRHRVGAGSIVAVDVSSEVEPLAVAAYGPGLSGWRVLGRRLNPFTPPHPVPGIAEILNRSTGLSQVRHRRAALDDDRVDLLLSPPVARLRSLDFKGGDRAHRDRLPVRRRRAGQVRARQTVRELSPAGDNRGMGELPAGTVTMLFSDIEGSTVLLSRRDDQYWRCRRIAPCCVLQVAGSHSGPDLAIRALATLMFE